MAIEKTIWTKTCRCFRAGKIWVSEDGVSAFKEGAENKLTIRTTDTGEKYVVVGREKKKVSIALAVITCFCPPPPHDGKRYIINHKDGNVRNCHRYNLEWIEKHYIYNTEDSCTLTIGKEKIIVRSNGTIWNGKQQLQVYDQFDDRDVDLFDSIAPYVHIDNKRVDIDDLMAKSGFIQGDDAVLQSPVILHKDYDRWNFDSSNLEWCERDDERYVEYLEKIKEDRHRRRLELNPGKTLFPGW